MIPRWRPIVAIEKRDLASLGRFKDVAPLHRTEDFTDQISIWCQEGSLEAASDIFDTYLITGDSNLLRLANSIFEKHADEIPPRLRFAIESAHEPANDTLELRRSIAYRETDKNYVWKTIAVQKRRISEYPRDALAYLELARLYTICGHFEKAEEQLDIARSLAPENRVILRSTLKFYHIISDLKTGLGILRRSDRIRFDPWIQSAEVATSNALQTTSRFHNRKLVHQLKDGSVTRDSTELAMAIATLEKAHGVTERKIFKLVRQALPKSTENGFAQAIWLSNHSSREFLDRFPESKPSSEAYEAKLKLALAANDFQAAAGFAELWVEDQPFSQDAIIRYLNLLAVHTGPDQRSISFARRAAKIFNESWHVLNAALLLLVEAGELNAAHDVLIKLRRETPQGASRAFVQAAEGFYAFARGDFLTGREAYEAAAKTARQHRSNDLIVNSAMFWLRCEMVNGLISQECIKGISDRIDLAIKKGRLQDRHHLTNTWGAIKRKAAEVKLPESAPDARGEDLVTKTISQNLDDPELMQDAQLNL